MARKLNTLRVNWRKGMRLTDELFTYTDRGNYNLIQEAMALSAAGRFGLCPHRTPFTLLYNLTQTSIEVISLDIIAMTRGGRLIDSCFDSRNSNDPSITVQLPPTVPEGSSFLFTVHAPADRWQDRPDGTQQPLYTYALVGESTPLPDDALPLLRLKYSNKTWTIDDANFVPPCLFVSAHPLLAEQAQRFVQVLRSLNTYAYKSLQSAYREAVLYIWPAFQQLYIQVEKETELMTPLQLLAAEQRCVSAFVCGCEVGNVDISDPQPMTQFISAASNYRDIYSLIRQGIDLCYNIAEKLDRMSKVMPEEPTPIVVEQPKPAPVAPVLPPEALILSLRKSTIDIMAQHPDPAATVYWTTDGSTPSITSASGLHLVFDSGFTEGRRPEPPRTITVKLIAIKDGVSSQVATYQLTAKKDIVSWGGKVI